jgi:hypothetical protein
VAPPSVRLSQEEHKREVSKLCFEFFKHFTTISATAAAIELTLYQLFQLDSKVAIAGIVMLAVTLGLSVWGMLAVVFNAGTDEEFPGLSEKPFALMGITALLFGSGVLLFALVAISPPTEAPCILPFPLC